MLTTDLFLPKHKPKLDELEVTLNTKFGTEDLGIHEQLLEILLKWSASGTVVMYQEGLLTMLLDAPRHE